MRERERRTIFYGQVTRFHLLSVIRQADVTERHECYNITAEFILNYLHDVKFTSRREK